MEWVATYLVLGGFVGFFAGLFGIGGGLVLVPALLLLFEAQHFSAGIAMHLALGTSMATIVFTSLSSLRTHHQHSAVNWRVVRRITPAILFGTALGAVIADMVSARGLSIFFAIFVYFSAAQMLLDLRPHASRQLPGLAGMSLMGTFTGVISSLVSIGGGALVVPFLVWCNVSLRHAIGTAAAIGFPVALGGTLGYIFTGLHQPALPHDSTGYVFLPALLWVAMSSVITAPLGAKAAHRWPLKWLRRGFACLLLILATKMVLKVLI
jgi:uncharacterized membrane protein YfcA